MNFIILKTGIGREREGKEEMKHEEVTAGNAPSRYALEWTSGKEEINTIIKKKITRYNVCN